MAKLRASTLWIALPLSVLLVLSLLLILVDLFDRRLIAEPMIALIEDKTQRSLRVDRFDLRWGWPLSLHLGDVRFANAEWASEDPLLQAARVSVQINPVEVLNGAPYADVHVQDARVLIERSPEGQWNLPTTTGESQPGQPLLPVTVEVDGGRIIYQQDQRVDIDRLSLLPAGDEGQGVAASLRASSADMPLHVDATIARNDETWEGDATLLAGDSSLATEFTLRTGDTLRLRADIDSSELVPSQLARLQPAGGRSPEPSTLALPRLEGIDAQLVANVASLRTARITVEDLEARLLVEDGRAELRELKASIGEASLEASAAVDTTAPEPELEMAAELGRTPLASLPTSLSLPAGTGEVAARVAAALDLADRQLPVTPDEVLTRLAIDEGRFLYAPGSDGQEQELVARLAVQPAGGQPSVALELEGVPAPPFEAEISAPPLRRLADEGAYPVELLVSSGGTQARFQARLDQLLQGAGMKIDFSIRGDELPALPVFDFTPPAVPEFGASGTLRVDANVFSAQDLELRYGESRATGSVAYRDQGMRPRLIANLDATLLDLSAIPTAGNGADAAAEADGETALVPEPVARALSQIDAEIRLSADRVEVPRSPSLRQARLEAQLEQGRLQVAPLAFEIAGGSVEGTLTARAVRSPLEGELAVDVEELRLGQFGQIFGPMEEHLGRVDGSLQLSVAERPATEPGPANLLLPTLGRLSFNSRLHFQNERAGTDFTLTAAAPDPAAPAAEQQLVIEADGRYRGRPVRLALHGDPLAALRNPRAPYELRMVSELGDLRARLEGQVTQPWSLRSARFDFSASAGDATLLETLLQPYYPVSVPPFEVDGALAYTGNRVSLRDFSAEFGDSDIRGELSLDMSADAPAVQASLHSDKLDLDDLPRPDGQGARSDETPVPDDAASAGGLLPERRIDAAFLRRASAHIDYSAGDFAAAGIPLGGITASFRLQDGHLVADPLRLDTPNGRLSLRIDLNARQSPLYGLVDADVRGINIAELLEEIPLAGDSFGLVGGQAKFWLSGDSVASLAGSADGGVMLLMTGGALDSLLVELIGLDFGEAALAAAGLNESTPIDCAYMSLHSRDGVLSVDRFVIDTEDTTFFLDGNIDFGRERLDLTLYPEAKDVSVPAAGSPIGITGSLAEPGVEVLSAELAARPLGALLTTALAAPLAAILPFVELGAQEEPSICRGWVDRLSREPED